MSSRRSSASASADDDCPYAILGVSRNATMTEIKSSYRKLALRHHPDKCTGTDADREAATAAFAKIGNAYEILSDDRRRREYDAAIHGEGSAFGGGGRRGNRSRGFDDELFRSAAAGGRFGGDSMGDPFINDPFFASASSRRSGGVLGGGIFGGGRGFVDPFELFDRVFAEEFGHNSSHHRHGGGRRRSHEDDAVGGSGEWHQQSRRRQRVDPFDDPFFSPSSSFFGGGSGNMMGGGSFGGSSMDRMMSRHFGAMDRMMNELMGAHATMGAGARRHQHDAYLGFGGEAGHESVSTTTHVINGKRRTRTERTVRLPDGTVEQHVEEKEDEDFPSSSDRIEGGGGTSTAGFLPSGESYRY